MNQQELCPKPALILPGTPRPKETDPDIIRAASLGLSKDIQNLWGDACDATAEEIADDIIKCLKYSWQEDGYKLMKDLEDHCHWTGSSDTVEILDDIWSRIGSARDKATAEWIAATGIRPRFKLGDTVEVLASKDPRSAKEKVSGTISHVYEKTGQYSVCIHAYGHLISGTPEAEAQLKKTGSVELGQVFTWEDVDWWNSRNG